MKYTQYISPHVSEPCLQKDTKDRKKNKKKRGREGGTKRAEKQARTQHKRQPGGREFSLSSAPSTSDVTKPQGGKGERQRGGDSARQRARKYKTRRDEPKTGQAYETRQTT